MEFHKVEHSTLNLIGDFSLEIVKFGHKKELIEYIY